MIKKDYKKKRAISTIVLMLGIFLSIPFNGIYSHPLVPPPWIPSPDSNITSPNTPESVRVVSAGDASHIYIGIPQPGEGTQIPGIYGVSRRLPLLYAPWWRNWCGYRVELFHDLYTWDSYRRGNGGCVRSSGHPGLGFWDSFSVVVTQGAPYWNIPYLTNPIVSSVGGQMFFVLLQYPADLFEWGGQFCCEQKLENKRGRTSIGFYMCDQMFFTEQDSFYLNFVLDTKTPPDSDSYFPSWGNFTDVRIYIIPWCSVCRLFLPDVDLNEHLLPLEPPWVIPWTWDRSPGIRGRMITEVSRVGNLWRYSYQLENIGSRYIRMWHVPGVFEMRDIPPGSILNYTIDSPFPPAKNPPLIELVGYEDDGSGWRTGLLGISLVPVPEPGTMLLLGSGLVGLAALTRRRKRKI